MDRVPGINFGLGIRHIILGAFLIRLEPEICVPESREECLADRFTILDSNILPRNDTRCGVVGHEPGRSFGLLAPETAVNREEPERKRGFFPRWHRVS